jgi:hypothetical protein
MWLLNYILMLNHSVLHEGSDTPTEFLTKSLHFGGGEGLCTAEKAWEIGSNSLHFGGGEGLCAAEKEAWEFLKKSLHC